MILPVPSHRRARLACDLAAAGADGAGAMVRPIAPNGAQSAYRYQSAWRVEGDTRPHPDEVSQTSPARRRLMGLGDKTATTRRPELADKSSARSV